LAHSPYLSDTVLLAYSWHTGVAQNQMQSVHNANKPVSPRVWIRIQELGYDNAVVTAIQNEFPISARESLEGQLHLIKADLQHIYSEKLNYFLQDTLPGSQDTVIRLLHENRGEIPNTVPQLVNAYANAGYYSRAFAYADSLSSDPKYSELMAIQTAFLKLDTTGKKMYGLQDDSLLRDLFGDYSSDSTKAGGMSARAVMHEIFGNNMNFVYLLPDEDGITYERKYSSEYVSEKTSIDIEEFATLQVFPNPANSSFVLVYNNSSAKTLEYSICDLLGKQYSLGKISTNVPLIIPTDRFVNGIYFITLIQDNKVLEKKKLVIMK
jgi:hypothetical protein